MASWRLRMPFLIDELTALGWSVQIGEEIDETYDLVVIPKIPGGHEYTRNPFGLIKLLNRLKEKGAFLLVDFVDDVIGPDQGDQSARQFLYRALISEANVVTTSSMALRDVVSRMEHKAVEYVPDAIDSIGSEPRQSHREKGAWLWFGHSTNISSLAEFFDRYNHRDSLPKHLKIVTNSIGIKKFVEYPFRRRPKLEVDFIQWDKQFWIKVAPFCNKVIITGGKVGASENRLIQALAFQYPVLATSTPLSYQVWDQYFCSQDFDRCCETFEQNLDFWQMQAVSASAKIKEKFGRQAITAAWRSALALIE